MDFPRSVIEKAQHSVAEALEPCLETFIHLDLNDSKESEIFKALTLEVVLAALEGMQPSMRVTRAVTPAGDGFIEKTVITIETPWESAEGEVPGPHSRACGWRKHDHGAACHRNCPTCGGK